MGRLAGVERRLSGRFWASRSGRITLGGQRRDLLSRMRASEGPRNWTIAFLKKSERQMVFAGQTKYGLAENQTFEGLCQEIKEMFVWTAPKLDSFAYCCRSRTVASHDSSSECFRQRDDHHGGDKRMAGQERVVALEELPDQEQHRDRHDEENRDFPPTKPAVLPFFQS